MPNKNGTGPEGKGPKTGRGLGRCGDATSKSGGRGRGMGFGRNVEDKTEDKEKA